MGQAALLYWDALFWGQEGWMLRASPLFVGTKVGILQ